MKKNYSAPRIQVIEMGNEGNVCDNLPFSGSGGGRPAEVPSSYDEGWPADEEYRSHL